MVDGYCRVDEIAAQARMRASVRSSSTPTVGVTDDVGGENRRELAVSLIASLMKSPH